MNVTVVMLLFASHWVMIDRGFASLRSAALMPGCIYQEIRSDKTKVGDTVVAVPDKQYPDFMWFTPFASDGRVIIAVCNSSRHATTISASFSWRTLRKIK